MVTVEYRQGILGFFKPARGAPGRDAEAGNAGLLDVMAALRMALFSGVSSLDSS